MIDASLCRADDLQHEIFNLSHDIAIAEDELATRERPN